MTHEPRESTHPIKSSTDKGKEWRDWLLGRSGKVGWRPWVPTIILALAFIVFVAWVVFEPEPKPTPPPNLQAFGSTGGGVLTVSSRVPDIIGPAILPPQPLLLKGSLCNNTGAPLETHVTTKFRRFANGEPEYERPYRPLAPVTFPVGCTNIDLSLGIPFDLLPGKYVFYGDIFVNGTGEKYTYETEVFLVLPLPMGGH